jgi:type II secretory ATPase GspE/PulE/Tfp pilus assembly ATPase PilB-like protein/tetratricopeptide (TPR) repeat protein
MKWRWPCQVVLCGLLMLALPPASLGDQIIKTDGKVITGEIISDDGESVVIKQGSVLTTISHKDILTLERKPPAMDLLAPARRSMQQGAYHQAITEIIGIVKKTPTEAEDARRLFTPAVIEALGKAQNSLDRGKYDEAISQFQFLWDALEEQNVKDTLFEDLTQWYALRNDVQKGLATSYYQRAKRSMEEDPPQLGAAEQDLLQAKAFVRGSTDEHFRILLDLAKVQRGQKKWDEALKNLEYVGTFSPDISLRNEANSLISVMRSEQAGFPQPAITPLPAAPTPAATMQPAIQAPEATPAPPPPAPRPGTLPKWKVYLNRVKGSRVFQVISDVPRQVAEGEYLGFIIGIPLAIVLLWILPYQLIKRRSARGDVLATQYRNSIKMFGLPVYVAYLVRQIKLGGPKKRCPFCNRAIDDIEAYTDMNFYICPHCRENITPVYDLNDYIDHLVKQLEREIVRGKKGGRGGEALVEKDAMLKLVRALITLAAQKRSSDLHIEPEGEGVKVRVRIDGMLHEMMNLPRALASSLVSAIKVMANLDIAEKRIPQDGKFDLWVDKSDIDIRASSSPAAMGEKVSLRLLDTKTIQVDSTKLGLEGENLEKFERAIRKPHGIILVTGPSGCGKSTTLYVALNTINTGEKNIITIEDPIEYRIKGVNQLQVNPSANFTFATGLRSILRQDPDVIMVGEIRDRETADIAVDAAVTGHLVFSTLHTIDTASAFARLWDLGVEPRRFASALIAMVAQRLIRINCSECKKPYRPKKTDLDSLGISTADKDIVFMKGQGCAECNNTGFYGRLGIFEILTPDDAMREILETNVATSVIRELGRKKGMRTLREEGIVKVLQGLTTVEEVIRVTS